MLRVWRELVAGLIPREYRSNSRTTHQFTRRWKKRIRNLSPSIDPGRRGLLFIPLKLHPKRRQITIR
jgi:hypothetical protein